MNSALAVAVEAVTNLYRFLGNPTVFDHLGGVGVDIEFEAYPGGQAFVRVGVAGCWELAR